MNAVTKFTSDEFLFVSPTATRILLAEDLFPRGEVVDAVHLSRVATVRKRVANKMTGQRSTRDWRIGYFLLWEDGTTSSNMGLDQYRAILREAAEHRIDKIIVYCRTATIWSQAINVRQFLVRDLETVS